MTDSIYPLPMAFPSSLGPIYFVIDPDGWRFTDGDHRHRFEHLPAAERLDLRRALAAQVELANDTPKGDT